MTREPDLPSDRVDTEEDLNRRQFLAGTATSTFGALAGCRSGHVGTSDASTGDTSTETPTGNDGSSPDASVDPFDYEGRGPDAQWREEARERIETYRKAPLEVTVTDAAGIPVSAASVEVTMREHEFNWGTAANGEKVVDDETSDRDTYRTVLVEKFNYSTVENRLRAFKWRDSAENRSEAREMVEWLDENGHDVRGHALFWEDYDWMDVDPDQSKEEVDKAVRDRIDERASEFGG